MKTFVYISSWTHGEPDSGIALYELNEETGELAFIEKFEKDVSFNVTVIDKERNLLYAVNETAALPGMRGCGGGQVYVFSFNRENGRLTKIGSKPTWCPNPSFIALDPERKYAIVSNHGGMSAATKIVKDMHGKYHPKIEFDDVCVELFKLNEDGMLGELVDVVKHLPNPLNPRSTVAHPHSAVLSPDGKLFAVCDKGNDTIRMYSIDYKAEKLITQAAPLQYEGETKPRYCLFHPAGKYFYHNNEGSLEFCAYTYDETGKLSLINRIETQPDGYEKRPGPHEQQGLCMHPNGKVIYDIVRGPNIVCVMKINETDGSVQKIQSVPVDDVWPRGCAISEDGKFLIVCGLKGGKAFVYSVDNEGLLSDSGNSVDQCAAAYVSFMKV